MVKYRLLLIAGAVCLSACDSQKNAAQDAERQKLEAERAQLEKDKAQLTAAKELAEEKKREAERLAAEAEKNALVSEARRLEAEGARLQVEKEKLVSDKAKLKADKAAMTEAEQASQAEAAAIAAEQKAAIAMAEAKNTEEREKLAVIRFRAERERMAAERAVADAKAREAAVKQAQEAAIRQTIALFHAPLEAMGDWIETDRYGFVWRPTVSIGKGHGWRPYADGRWHFTDFGWTWQSNEPFGWAVYHYGRWARLPEIGWVWVPGNEWAPAWVAWRWHRPREFVGWAPLPPEAQSSKGYDSKVDVEFDIGPGNYSFIAVADIDAPSYLGKFVAQERLREILPLTTNVTYIAPKAGGGMVCGGPDTGMINAELRKIREDFDIKPIGKVGLHLLNSPATSAAPDIFEAGALTLFAPQIKSNTASSRPRKVKARLEVKQAERGWDPTSPWEADVWRAKVRAEAAQADAAERAAAIRAKQPPPPVRPAATPTPAPKPANTRPRPPQPRQGGPSGLGGGSRLEPSSPLFPKRN